jgi:hypothetical protein
LLGKRLVLERQGPARGLGAFNSLGVVIGFDEVFAVDGVLWVPLGALLGITLELEFVVHPIFGFPVVQNLVN